MFWCGIFAWRVELVLLFGSLLFCECFGGLCLVLTCFSRGGVFVFLGWWSFWFLVALSKWVLVPDFLVGCSLVCGALLVLVFIS